MLNFWSAGNEIVNSKKAMQACLDGMPIGKPDADAELLVLHTTMGHDFQDLIEAAKEISPGVNVVGCTGCGVIGSNKFVSEKMRSLAVMGIRGDSDDMAISYTDDIRFDNSYEASLKIATSLKEQNAGINMILLLGGFLDMVADQSFAAFENVFGPRMPLFGGTATDNLKAVKSNLFCNGNILEHGLLAVGFADPTLNVTMGVHHGNMAVGQPFIVTRAEGNQILEIDSQPAWPFIMDRMELPVETRFEDALRVVCFAEKLPQPLQAEYDNSHIMYVPVGTEKAKQSFNMAVTIEEGTKLWIAQREERKMFDGLDQMVSKLADRLDGQQPVAVFHADCAARGRMSLSEINKSEIVSRMQTPLCKDECVPWLGLYGYGEFTQLGGKNVFHNQTTSLYVLTRSGA
jgi:hypothetical protein